MVDLFASSFGNLSVKNQLKIGDNITLNSNGVVSATTLLGNGAGLSGVGEFASGTEVMFVQTSAPTGFTTNTSSTLTECCLQVVSGTGGGTGGTDSFSSVFSGSKSASASSVPLSASNLSITGLAASAHTLSTPELPSHNHPYPGGTFTPGLVQYSGSPLPTSIDPLFGTTSGATGGGGGHSHPLSGISVSGTLSSDISVSVPNMNLKYADSIIATKD